MGTRRPLILQMVHDPMALEPRCRFQVWLSVFLFCRVLNVENHSFFGLGRWSSVMHLILCICEFHSSYAMDNSFDFLLQFVDLKLVNKQEEDSDEYGSPVVLASAIADIIKSRTEALLKKTKTSVSSKPIVMRAEYAHCPNLTIIDTPGFVLKVGCFIYYKYLGAKSF